MSPNPQFPADLVVFTEEILSEKLHFLCSRRLQMQDAFLLECCLSGYVNSVVKSGVEVIDVENPGTLIKYCSISGNIKQRVLRET